MKEISGVVWGVGRLLGLVFFILFYEINKKKMEKQI